MRRGVVITVTALTLVVANGRVRANPAEVFGFGSRNAARGGAVAATIDDFAAGYYNPAGLGFSTGKHLSVGALASMSNLHINDERSEISEPFGFTFGVTLPAPLGGPLANRFVIGFGMYALPGTVAQIIARLPDEPFYPYYDNRTQRVVILPALAARLTDELSIGVASNFLATLNGRVTASEGATRALEARVDEQIPSIARLNAGVRWQPLTVPHLSLALAYRQSFSIPFATVAQTRVAGEPINLDIAAVGQYTPTQVTAAAAWRSERAEIGLDVTWGNWSAYPGPFVQVKSELPLVGPLAGQLPEVPFSDTVGVRVGGEVLIDSERTVALRGGYAFETSPVPAQQTGVTNLLDGYKNTVSTGLGLRLPRALDGREVRFDLHVQAQLVADRTMSKVITPSGEPYDSFAGLRDEVTDQPGDPASAGAQISNPGYPSISSGGEVYSAGFSVEVEF